MFTPLNGQYQPKHKPRIFARKSCPVAIDVMDLDSTLTSSAAEEALEQALVDEMAQYFPDNPREEAIAINQAGYRKYGTTALFIEHEFGVPQDEFVRAAYTRFHESCGHMYQPNADLTRALQRHDRPRMIFTASPMFHAKFVLNKMRIWDAFDGIEAADGALIAGRKKYAISVLRDLRLHIWDSFKAMPQHVAIYDDKSAVLNAAKEEGFGHRIQVRDRTATFHGPITDQATMHVKCVPSALGALAA
ncbi:MAG: hypothetical protein VX730_01835 [Pseudomonadota bacterium]|nr:hypothetical protein [Pseudomonadota bacterium]